MESKFPRNFKEFYQDYHAHFKLRSEEDLTKDNFNDESKKMYDFIYNWDFLEIWYLLQCGATYSKEEFLRRMDLFMIYLNEGITELFRT